MSKRVPNDRRDVPSMIAEVRAWLPEIASLAVVGQTETEGYWALQVVPSRKGAKKGPVLMFFDPSPLSRTNSEMSVKRLKTRPHSPRVCMRPLRVT